MLEQQELSLSHDKSVNWELFMIENFHENELPFQPRESIINCEKRISTLIGRATLILCSSHSGTDRITTELDGYEHWFAEKYWGTIVPEK